MIKLYGMFPTRAIRGLWALEEAEADYEFVPVDLSKGDHKSEEYLKIHPGGKVPALQDGNLVLFESGAICTYIGDKYPEKNLLPKPGTPQRALYDQWLFFALTELEQPLWTITKHSYVLPKEMRIPDIFKVAQYEFGLVAKVLDKGLGDNEFIMGETFTMADILLGQTLFWAKSAKVPLGSDRLEAYVVRLKTRPGFLRVREKHAPPKKK